MHACYTFITQHFRCRRNATLVLLQAGIGLLDVPRVEVFINSSRLSSKLKVDIKLLPIRALLEGKQGVIPA